MDNAQHPYPLAKMVNAQHACLVSGNKGLRLGKLKIQVTIILVIGICQCH